MASFDEEKNGLEDKGWAFGGTIPCPAVGGDHDAEIWVSPDGTKTAEVCKICQFIDYK